MAKMAEFIKIQQQNGKFDALYTRVHFDASE